MKAIADMTDAELASDMAATDCRIAELLVELEECQRGIAENERIIAALRYLFVWWLMRMQR